MSHRLFFSLWPHQALRETLSTHAAQLRKQLDANPAPVASHHLHLTLLFIGQVDDPAQVETLIDATHALRIPPFTIQLSRCGCFALRRPLLWIGPDSVPAPMRTLHQGLKNIAIRQNLLRSASRWRPHVTLFRRLNQAPKNLPVYQLPPWPVDQFTLVNSAPGAKGPDYQILARFSLRQAKGHADIAHQTSS